MNCGSLTLPPPLRRGDRVALLAPASPGTPERWRAGQRALEHLGYQVVPGDRLSPEPGGYAAGPAVNRAEALNRAFSDPEIRGIWCLRGGYTTAQLLPLLDYEEIARHPKVFVGYSDITGLHTALNQRCGFVTYHGPMAASDLAEQPHPETVASLCAALAGERRFYNPGGEPLRCLRPGTAEGILTGGNLTILVSRLGTPWALEPVGKLLFLEDVGEQVPVLERMLTQLRDAGVFQAAAGVLLGAFTDCKNRCWPEYGPMELCRDFFRDYEKPVLSGLRCGHCRPNGTLPLGRRCRVDAQRGELRFL
ncbi:MAG: LD-carboxypeptidase [Candidatus Onthomonas sp.]